MAVKVNYWKAIDDSLHPTEKEAVAKDLEIIGEDAFYEKTLKLINDAYGESKSFRYNEIPETIAYRLMYAGYVGQLYTSVSNAEFDEQYDIIFYKKGIEPTKQLCMVIQHLKNEEYKKIYGSK